MSNILLLKQFRNLTAGTHYTYIPIENNGKIGYYFYVVTSADVGDRKFVIKDTIITYGTPPNMTSYNLFSEVTVPASNTSTVHGVNSDVAGNFIRLKIANISVNDVFNVFIKKL